MSECKQCGGTNHIAKVCRWKGRAKPTEARDGHGSCKSQGTSIKAVHCSATTTATPALNPDLDKVLSQFVTTMHTITSQQNAQLGLTPTTEVQVEGCPVTALLDTGSPLTIISLDFLLQTLAE